MSPEEYETIVSEIVADICRGAPELSGMTLGFGLKNKLQGASCYKHQIDVSLEGFPDTYLIECKRWDKKIGVQEIMVLAARGTDIAQLRQNVKIHCSLATKIGATRGAVTLAQYFGIELEIVRSAQEFGMRIGKRISLGMVDRVLATSSLSFTVIRDGVVVSDGED